VIGLRLHVSRIRRELSLRKPPGDRQAKEPSRPRNAIYAKRRLQSMRDTPTLQHSSNRYDRRRHPLRSLITRKRHVTGFVCLPSSPFNLPFAMKTKLPASENKSDADKKLGGQPENDQDARDAGVSSATITSKPKKPDKKCNQPKGSNVNSRG